ncbi:MAG: hypothetical protein WBV82_01610 [Myxococcaceae bacterium]
MSFSRVVALLACAALVGCATTPPPAPAKAPEPPNPEVVALHFGWKPGMKATVETRNERVNGPRTQETTVRASLVVQQVADGLALTSPEVEVEGGVELPGMKDLTAAAAKAHLIVDADGKPVRVEGIEELKQAVDAFLAATPAPPAAVESLKASMSRQAIEAKEFDSWNQLVGFWNGGELKLGATYELPPQPTQAANGATFEMSMRYGAKERVPCTEGSTESRCVLLEAVSTPEPKSLEVAMSAFLGPLLQSLVAQRIESSGMSMSTTFTVIAEPDTLVPHRFEWSRILRMNLRLPNGEEHPFESRDSVVRTYTW